LRTAKLQDQCDGDASSTYIHNATAREVKVQCFRVDEVGKVHGGIGPVMTGTFSLKLE
jgi:hypothetical protein